MGAIEFADIAAIAAVGALAVALSILTGGTMAILHGMKIHVIKFDSSGKVMTRSSEAVDLWKRLLRFPQKARWFYYAAMTSLFFVVLLRSVLIFFDVAPNEWTFIIFTMLLVFSVAYALYLVHSVYVYKRELIFIDLALVR